MFLGFIKAPEGVEPNEGLVLRVFEDLTLNKGLYLTDGLKFGADFLAY